jgi:hypothetical protein
MLRSAEPPVTAMGNVVNLGRARKRRREAAEKQRADENAIRHGRTKAEKARERMEQARLRAAVDGARLEPATEPNDGEPEAHGEPES